MVADYQKEAYRVMSESAAKTPSDESIDDMLFRIAKSVGAEMKTADLRYRDLKMTLARILSYSKRGKDITDLLVRAEDLLARHHRIEDVLR